MYDQTDPRAKLASQGANAVPEYFNIADYIRFNRHKPVETSETQRTWWSRGQNFVIGYSECVEGDEFVRSGQLDEYVVLLPDETSRLSIDANGTVTDVPGGSIAVVPPGYSKITVQQSGRVVRLFTARNEDLLELPINQASYLETHQNVAPFSPWPDSPGASSVRVYSLDVPPEKGRFGRIWRCSTFMVSFLDPYDGPRDPATMSPHSHTDFEQCSLAIQGEFIHHLRYPWTVDSRKWHEDEHEVCGTPSVAIIPPYATHTTQAVGAGINQLVDIFCPPRMDFSQQPGWVLNVDDYPLVPSAEENTK